MCGKFTAKAGLLAQPLWWVALNRACCSDSGLWHAAAIYHWTKPGTSDRGSCICTTPEELQISLSNSTIWLGILLLSHSAPDSCDSQPVLPQTSLSPVPLLSLPCTSLVPASSLTFSSLARTSWFHPPAQLSDSDYPVLTFGMCLDSGFGINLACLWTLTTHLHPLACIWTLAAVLILVCLWTLNLFLTQPVPGLSSRTPLDPSPTLCVPVTHAATTRPDYWSWCLTHHIVGDPPFMDCNKRQPLNSLHDG